MKDRLKMAANLNRIAAAIAMDRWEEIGENTNIWNPDEAAQDFECDPLYLIIMLQRNKMDADIPSILRSILKSPRDIDGYLPEIIPDDMMQAKTIRNYYRNILLVKTLKDEVVTDQNKMLNIIINNDKAINRELIPLLVRLPSMYIEDVETTEIFKQGVSPKKNKKKINPINFYYGSISAKEYIEIAKFSTMLKFGRIPSFFRSPETKAIPCFFASSRVLIEEKSSP